MKILNLVNKCKWLIIIILSNVLINIYYIKLHSHIDNYLCQKGIAIEYCAESKFFKDNYKQYAKFMLNNYNNESLLENEIFNQNFTQILKVCEITNDCNISQNDLDKYKENRRLCSKYYKFCRIEYLFYEYNDSLLVVKPGFKEYLFFLN